MDISPAGIDFIKANENCRLAPYDDSGGRATIGWGHLILPGEAWDTAPITQQQADDLLHDDLATSIAAVNRLADPSCNQSQFDALCDFCFNLGEGALTTMLGHGWELVPMQMVRWDHAGGKVLEGLERRRQAEAALFTS